MVPIDDILLSGGLAGLLGATIRIGTSWLLYLVGWQSMTLSHIYSLLFLRTLEPAGLVVGSISFVSLWVILGTALAQLLAWYGFKYWWVKGPGLVIATWPIVYLASQLAYRGPPATPSSVNALTSLSVSLVAALAAAGFLARVARWPVRGEIRPGPAAAVRPRVQVLVRTRDERASRHKRLKRPRRIRGG